jgi:hypothetical protein
MTKQHFFKLKNLVFFLGLLFIGNSAALGQVCPMLGDTTVCENEIVPYSTSLSGAGYTYQWNAFGGAVSGSGMSVNVAWGTPGVGQVTLVVRDALNIIVCTRVYNVIIYAGPKPFILPNIDAKCGQLDTGGATGQKRDGDNCLSVCDSTWVTYSTINNPGNTYVWAITGSAIIIPSVTNSIQVYWTGVGTGLVTVTETNAQGCIAMNSLCVQIVAKPNASFATMPAASGGIVNACLNQTIQFINTSTIGGGSPFFSYTWVWGDGTSTTLPGNTNGNSSHAYSVAAAYNVMLILENDCHCKDTAYVTVIVNSSPGPDIQCVSTVCPGTSVTYTTSVVCPNYLWTVANGTIVGSDTSPTVTVIWGATGPGYLTLQTLGCTGTCPSPTTVVVPIITPSAAITGKNLVCQYDCETYHLDCTIPVDSIIWTVPAGITLIGNPTNMHDINLCFYAPSFTTGVITATYFHNTPGAKPSLTCGGSANFTINVRPKLYLSYPSEICDQSILTGSYTNSPSGNIQWTIVASGGLTVFSSIQPANVNLNPTWVWGPGIFTITATDLSGNYCNSPQSFVLKVNPIPPRPDSITGAKLVCPNTPYQYLGFATTSNLSLSWTVIGGAPASAAGPFISVLWGPTPPYQIILSQVDPKTGCRSDTIQYNVNSMLPLSPSLIAGPILACANTIVLSAYTTSSPGTDFAWTISPSTAGSVTSGNHTNTISVQWNNYTGPAMITLVRTVCGTTISTNYSVNLTSPGAPNISVPSPVCQGSTVNMSSSTPGATFAWNFGNGATGAGSPVSYVYNSPGTYVVTLTANYTGSCPAVTTAISTIVVNPKPNVNISTPNPNIFCGPVGMVNMFVASPAILTTYAWYRAPSTFLAPGTSYSSSTIGNYFVVATNTFGCMDTSNVIPIDTVCDTCRINPTYSVSLTIIKQGCNKDSFVGSSSPVGSSPTFNFDDPYGSPNIVSGTNATHTFPEPGFYRVRFCVKFPNIWNTDSCTLCDMKVDTIKYIADFYTSLSCLPGKDSVLVSLINTTKILSGFAAPSYAWSVNGGPTFSTLANPSINLAPGTYTFTLVANGNCIKNVVVTIPALPNASFTVVDSICVNTPMIFANTSTGVYNSILWTFGDGSNTTISSPPIRTYSAPGIYYVNLYISNNFGCIDTFKDTVVVLPNTLSALAVPSGPVNFCEGGSVIINAIASSGYPAYNYLWSTTQATPSITAIYTGQYYVDVMDSKRCFVRSSPVNVLVKPQPRPNITGPIVVCQGENPTFSVNYPSTPYIINWSLDGAVTPWYNQSNYQIFSLSIGTHTLIVRITSPDTCIGSDTFNFTVVPRPNVNIIAGGSLCAGVPNLLIGTSISTNILSYFWNTGSINDSLFTSIAGNYSFTVVDSNGCRNSKVKGVNPLPDFCGLMTGCYDICDTVTRLVWHGPKGYAGYQWLFNNLQIPGSIFDTLHIPLYQSGTYRLVLTTAAGCTDTSENIDINFIKCDSCIKIVKTIIDCGPLNMLGNQTYTVSMTIVNNLAAGANVSISSPQGSISGLIPVTLALGANTVNFTFTDVPAIDTQACFNVVVWNQNTDCIAYTCIKLPPCGGDCKDTIRWKSFDCKGFDGAGNPIYTMCVNVYWGGSNGSTLTFSTASGSFSLNPATVNNGWQTICVNYTDLPPATGFATFYFTFYDPITKLTCRDSLKRDYVQCKDSCRLAVVGLCAHCHWKDTTKVYTIELTVNNTLGGPASVSIPPFNTGTIGVISPPILPSGVGTVSFPFIDTGAKDSIVCFRIYLTVGNKICYQDVCVYLPDSCEKEHSGILNMAQFSYFMLAPNPAKESVQLSFSKSNIKDRSVQIKDINGRLIYRKDLKLGDDKLDIETDAWVNGIYFVSLIQEGKYRGSIKLKIEK